MLTQSSLGSITASESSVLPSSLVYTDYQTKSFAQSSSPQSASQTPTESLNAIQNSSILARLPSSTNSPPPAVAGAFSDPNPNADPSARQPLGTDAWGGVAAAASIIVACCGLLVCILCRRSSRASKKSRVPSKVVSGSKKPHGSSKVAPIVNLQEGAQTALPRPLHVSLDGAAYCARPERESIAADMTAVGLPIEGREALDVTRATARERGDGSGTFISAAMISMPPALLPPLASRPIVNPPIIATAWQAGVAQNISRGGSLEVVSDIISRGSDNVRQSDLSRNVIDGSHMSPVEDSRPLAGTAPCHTCLKHSHSDHSTGREFCADYVASGTVDHHAAVRLHEPPQAMPGLVESRLFIGVAPVGIATDRPPHHFHDEPLADAASLPATFADEMTACCVPVWQAEAPPATTPSENAFLGSEAQVSARPLAPPSAAAVEQEHIPRSADLLSSCDALVTTQARPIQALLSSAWLDASASVSAPPDLNFAGAARGAPGPGPAVLDDSFRAPLAEPEGQSKYGFAADVAGGPAGRGSQFLSIPLRSNTPCSHANTNIDATDAIVSSSGLALRGASGIDHLVSVSAGDPTACATANVASRNTATPIDAAPIASAAAEETASCSSALKAATLDLTEVASARGHQKAVSPCQHEQQSVCIGAAVVQPTAFDTSSMVRLSTHGVGSDSGRSAAPLRGLDSDAETARAELAAADEARQRLREELAAADTAAECRRAEQAAADEAAQKRREELAAADAAAERWRAEAVADLQRFEVEKERDDRAARVEALAWERDDRLRRELVAAKARERELLELLAARDHERRKEEVRIAEALALEAVEGRRREREALATIAAERLTAKQIQVAEEKARNAALLAIAREKAAAEREATRAAADAARERRRLALSARGGAPSAAMTRGGDGLAALKADGALAAQIKAGPSVRRTSTPHASVSTPSNAVFSLGDLGLQLASPPESRADIEVTTSSRVREKASAETARAVWSPRSRLASSTARRPVSAVSKRAKSLSSYVVPAYQLTESVVHGLSPRNHRVQPSPQVVLPHTARTIDAEGADDSVPYAVLEAAFGPAQPLHTNAAIGRIGDRAALPSSPMPRARLYGGPQRQPLTEAWVDSGVDVDGESLISPSRGDVSGPVYITRCTGSNPSSLSGRSALVSEGSSRTARTSQPSARPMSPPWSLTSAADKHGDLG